MVISREIKPLTALYPPPHTKKCFIELRFQGTLPKLFLFPILKYFSIATCKGLAFDLITIFFLLFAIAVVIVGEQDRRESSNQFTKLRQNVSYKFCYRKVGRAIPKLGSDREINNLIVQQKTFWVHQYYFRCTNLL